MVAAIPKSVIFLGIAATSHILPPNYTISIFGSSAYSRCVCFINGNTMKKQVKKRTNYKKSIKIEKKVSKICTRTKGNITVSCLDEDRYIWDYYCVVERSGRKW